MTKPTLERKMDPVFGRVEELLSAIDRSMELEIIRFAP
jgi:hypothetical protein